MIDRHIEHLLDDYDRGTISRRHIMACLTGMAAMVAGAPVLARQDQGADTGQPAGAPTFKAVDVNHLALRVTDIERSRVWYEKHLGLEVTSISRSSCFMKCSKQNFLAMFRHDTPGMDHYCFSVPEYDAADAVERLTKAGLTPRRSGNRVYFDDPDGIEVQVAATDHAA